MAIALSVFGAHFVTIAEFAVGSALGPLFRAAVAVRERHESADIVQETIATVVIASSGLIRTGIPTGMRNVYGNYSETALEQFAPALRAGTDTPDWHGRERPYAHLSEATQRWSRVAECLEEARRHFVRESAGLYLIPNRMARNVNTVRARLADATTAAYACASVYRRLFTLEMNSGLPPHKERAETDLAISRGRVALAIDEIVAAHGDLLREAWKVIPERMGELFDTDGRRKEQRARAFIRESRDALRETVENAAVVRKDTVGTAAGEAVDPSQWLGRSTLKGRGSDVTLADLLEPAFAFDTGQNITGWNWVSAQIREARSRFEQLRSDAVEFLTPEPAAVSYRLIRELEATANAAGLIANAQQMHPDCAAAATAAAAAPTAAFRELGQDVLDTIMELEQYAAEHDQ